MYPRFKSILIALILPAAILTAGILILGSSDATVFGIPAVFILLFAMFPITSGLMALSWRFFDRDADYDDNVAGASTGGPV